MVYLTKKQVIYLHSKLITKYGGEYGLMSENALESVIGAVQQTFDSKPLLNTYEDVAGAYIFYFINDHPFLDGNKRVGIFSALDFLELNKSKTHYLYNNSFQRSFLSLSKQELIEELYLLANSVAKGELKREDITLKLKGILKSINST